MQDFKDLIVWQKGVDLASLTYALIEKFPKNEMYALSDQLKRSAVSVPSNIAEGQQRSSTREYIRFLCISRGSLAELETQHIISERLKYIQMQQLEELSQLIETERKTLNALIASLRKKLSLQ